MNWQFMFSLLWWNDAMLIIDCTNSLLQAKRNDLFIILDQFKKAAPALKAMRNDEKFEANMERVKHLWVFQDFEEDEADI